MLFGVYKPKMYAIFVENHIDFWAKCMQSFWTKM